MIWNRIENGFQWITNRLFGKAKKLPKMTGKLEFQVIGQEQDLNISVGPMPGSKANLMLIQRKMEWYAEREVLWTPSKKLVRVEFRRGWIEFDKEL